MAQIHSTTPQSQEVDHHHKVQFTECKAKLTGHKEQLTIYKAHLTKVTSHEKHIYQIVLFKSLWSWFVE